jgi:L-asparaginase/Glu-tRNA(Gln) amidotransferase subunit D
MSNQNDLFKKLSSNGNTIYLSKQDLSLGVKDYYCSSYINSKKLLIKGEHSNPSSSQRKAMVVLTDPRTGDIKGRLPIL